MGVLLVKISLLHRFLIFSEFKEMFQPGYCPMINFLVKLLGGSIFRSLCHGENMHRKKQKGMMTS